MKLQPDKSRTPLITAHATGWIEVAGQRFEHSLLLSSAPESAPVLWRPQHYEELTAADFANWPLEVPELVLFGSGPSLRFPKPQWLAHLIQQRIGLETMDTAAACRTYNILASEGRQVAAALLL
jgi:uncharacterized protein